MRQSRREKAARMKKEAEEKKKIIRDALAAFFVGAALVIGHRVHWFTIRGDNELGLQLLTMLSVDEYATALLLGGLVNVTNNHQSGGYIVKTSDTSYWTPFLNEYQGEQEGELNLRDVAEATHTQVKAETFKHQHQGTKIGDTLHGLHLLRLGKYRKGETTKPSLQLTDYVEPPSCKSRQIRALQDRLLKAVSPVIKSIRPKTEQFKKAEAVAEWVRMPELEEDIATYTTSDRARKSTAFWKEEENAQKKTSDVSTKTPEPEPQDMNKPANEKNPKVSTHGKLIDEPSTKCSSTNHKIAHAGIADTNNIDSSFMNKTSASYPSKQVQSSVQIVQPGDSTNMEKGSGSHKDVQYLIPTPKATKKLIYPPEHKFAKFKTLNSLNMDVMNDTEGIEGMAATCNRQGLMREMFNYCEEYDIPNQFDTANGQKYHVVKIPISDDSDELLRKARRNKWIEEMLEASMKDGNLGDAMRCMFKYCLDRHGPVARENLRDLGVMPNQMNEFEIAVTINETKCGIGGWRMMVQCFKTYTGLERKSFAVTEDCWRRLGTDHGDVTANTYVYRKTAGKRAERIPWWTMCPASELELRLTDFANAQADFHPNMIAYIQSIYSGDHGKGKLRFGAKLDTGEIFKNTIHKNMAKGINKIEHGKVQFVKNDTTGRWKCSIIDKDHIDFSSGIDTICDVTPYMIGDLKFLSMMLGKENFEGYWCILCKMCHPEWQQGGYDVSTLLWDIEQLKAQAENSNTASGTDRKGVREEPYFDIPVERYIWPVLHTLIGVGNGILNHLVDIVESEIQAVPAKEILLKREVRELTRDIIALRKERDDFDSNDEGSGKETLKYLKKERTRMMKRMETIEDEHMGEGYTSDIDEEYVGLSLGLEDCKEEIERLTKEREDMASSIDRMGTKKTAKNKQLEEFRKARKTDDDSLYSLIDEILQEYGILRAAYHGGDLTGVCVRRLMTYSEEIMDSIAALLVDNKSPQCTMSDDNIRSLCENCSKLLTRWDGALHYLHEDNTEENCENATKFIDSALELSRSMGISVLPKHHGTEAHLVKQMRDVKGGLFEFDESWTEQYHQIGYQFDVKLRNKSERKKAEVRAANDRRINLPQSQAAKKKLDELKRGQRKTTQMKEADEKLKKKQRRENAL